MSPSCIALLGTVLCLGQVTPAQEEDLPRPSISAEPGPVVHPGSSVTFVCQGPPGVDIYRLEKKEGTSRYIVGDKEPLLGETEARFPITRASEDTEGHYRCVYYKGLRWSEFSGPLELQVTDEDTTQGPHPSAPSSQNYAVGNRVRMGLAGAVLLTLAAVLAEAWHSSGGPGKGPRAGDRTAPTGGI
ncbi:leukocyte-associated immunoglobulin-like receptor 2 isoform X1 [Dasypus novemcinctus]|uniref:leukocyte-associated immunoglobulin-like receptor 2 isoform X1 n=1 Tax=Dasypus novemcinctus TaxID=9361 RepID=UPI00265D89C7|nr:leukocyte-associated immunoglobulin-like receptor 2 isoform X1 [Dasypus novemcinctus]